MFRIQRIVSRENWQYRQWHSKNKRHSRAIEEKPAEICRNHLQKSEQNEMDYSHSTLAKVHIIDKYLFSAIFIFFYRKRFFLFIDQRLGGRRQPFEFTQEFASPLVVLVAIVVFSRSSNFFLLIFFSRFILTTRKIQNNLWLAVFPYLLHTFLPIISWFLSCKTLSWGTPATPPKSMALCMRKHRTISTQKSCRVAIALWGESGLIRIE